MNSPKVSIIIPVFNQLSYTKECIDSIYLHTDPKLFEVVLVNNNSTDGTSEWLSEFAKSHQNFRCITLASNQGFSPAVNAGANLSSAEFLLFLNNDTRVTAGWLEALLAVGQRDQVGIVGAKLVYPDTNTINHIGYVYSRSAGGFAPIYHHFDPESPCVNYEREFQALLGACLLCRRELFKQVGGFALYGLEDIDLCLRIRTLGLKVIYTPRALVYHHGSVTLKRSTAGSFPVTDTAKFNLNWPPSSLISDDIQQSALDGLEIRINPDGSLEFKENITSSIQLLKQAEAIRSAGDNQLARELLEKSLMLYARNKESLLSLVTLLLELRDFVAAEQHALFLVAHFPEVELGPRLLKEIRHSLPR